MADDGIGKIGGFITAGQLQAMASSSRAEGAAEALTKGARGEGPRNQAQMEKAAQDFEALLLQQMFQSMWQAVPQGELLGGGREGEYYRDMFIQGLANNVAEGQGIGIKQVILDELKQKK